MDIPTIEPFQFIRSTAFSERVQLANKLNEVIDAVNNIGDLPDLESQITEINSKISELEESIGSTDTSLADLENQVNGLIAEVNTTIKQRISALESEVDGIDTRLTTTEGTVSEHGTEIDGLLKKVIDSVEMSSNPHGTIRVQINHEDGTNDISAPIDLGLVEQGGIVLQSGTTDRSFKLIVNLTDGTSWQTNDFVIPEGGGTDVSVTNISIAQGTESSMIQVKIGLSDGSTISSNDWTVVTPTEFSALGTRVTTAEGNIAKNTGDISDLETRVQALEDSSGYTLQPATATTLGGVKIGAGIIVQSDGTISVDKTQINTAAVASTVMFTADASKVTLHADSVAGSEFTKDIPQASQGGAGTIDQESYAKIAATEAKVNGLAPTVTVNEEAEPPTITVGINGKQASANLPSGGGSGGKWESIPDATTLFNKLNNAKIGDEILGMIIQGADKTRFQQFYGICSEVANGYITFSGSGFVTGVPTNPSITKTIWANIATIQVIFEANELKVNSANDDLSDTLTFIIGTPNKITVTKVYYKHSN